MKFGSLFTGIGGFDLGFERAGMTCAWQVEIDAACQDVERRHWPNVKRYGDVQNVGKASLDSVDLICGGFPCQDVSVAGKRAGLAGERSGLWFEFHRILKELKPQWVVIENVPGLLSSEDGRDFAAILHGLVELRYGVCWRILDAQYFGVAQRRRRVFIVGSLGDGRAAQVLFERESGAGDTPPSREARARLTTDVTASLRSVSGEGSPNPDRLGTNGHGRIAYAVSSHHARNCHEENYVCADLAPTLQKESYSPTKTSTGQALDWCVVAPLTERMGRYSSPDPATGKGSPIVVARSTGAGWYTEDDKGSVRAESGGTTFDLIAFDHCLQGSERTWIHRGDGYAQLQATRPDAVAGNFGVRRLMPVECERLQGFPDGWTEWGVDESGKRVNQSDSTRYRQLGNAVCEPVAEWIGKRLKETTHHA